MANVLSRLSLLTFVGNFLFVQGLFVPTFGSNGPLWSLAFELWYYVWFPALWLWTKNRWSLGIVALGLAIKFPGLTAGFICWLTGSALYLCTSAIVRHRTKLNRAQMWFALVVTGATLLVILVFSRVVNDNSLVDFAISALFAMLLLLLYLLELPASKAVKLMARYGAASSFSLYAIHYPIAALTIALLAPYGRQLPGSATIATVFLIIAGLLAAGWAFSRVTEAKTQVVREMLRRALLPQPGGTRSGSAH